MLIDYIVIGMVAFRRRVIQKREYPYNECKQSRERWYNRATDYAIGGERNLFLWLCLKVSQSALKVSSAD